MPAVVGVEGDSVEIGIRVSSYVICEFVSPGWSEAGKSKHLEASDY